jgi:hypothetical protein
MKRSLTVVLALVALSVGSATLTGCLGGCGLLGLGFAPWCG